MLPASIQKALGRRPEPTARRTTMARRATSPSGYAMDVSRSGRLMSWLRTYGTIRSHPRQQPNAARDDGGIEEAGEISSRGASANEEHEPGDKKRVHRQVKEIDVRRERRGDVLHRVAEGVEVVTDDESGTPSASKYQARRASGRCRRTPRTIAATEDQPIAGQRKSFAGSGGTNA